LRVRAFEARRRAASPTARFDIVMPRIHILHESDEWTAPLRAALDELGLPYEAWFLDQGELDLATAPPEGVFYNRMSASSHTRGHRFAPELTAAVPAWLEGHGRRVLNGGRALQLEVSKVAQYEALRRHGVPTPRTVATVGREALLKAGAAFAGRPFITKHNRAGKGLGVRLFRGTDVLAAYVDSPAFEPSIDGIMLVQEYIEAPEPCITRVEFIGRRFLYAVRVDTSAGFELCPADVCAADGAAARPKFEIIEGFDHPLIPGYAAFLAANAIDVAGIEFITDRFGRAYTYDVNTNTNYNPEAERAAGVFGMRALAAYLGQELAQGRGVAGWQRVSTEGGDSRTRARDAPVAKDPRSNALD
jgi:hypothetical protein